MRITLCELRSLINELLLEIGSGNAGYPHIRDVVGPAMADREVIGSLADDEDAEGDELLPPHLREPKEDPEDIRGPIPASDEEPYAISDPYTSDYNVIPTPQGKMRNG